MEVELAIREDRPDDARELVLRAAPRIVGSDEATRLVRMAWMAQRAEAETAGRAQALGEPYAPVLDERRRARCASARRRARSSTRRAAGASWPTAELQRRRALLGDAPADPGPWERAARTFDALGLPVPATYARYRAAEAHVTAGDRAAAAVPLRAAAAAAAGDGRGAADRRRRGARAPRADRPGRGRARAGRPSPTTRPSPAWA